MAHEAEMTKMTVRLFTEDLQKLRQYYPQVGYNSVLRQLVRRHVQALDDKTEEIIQQEGAEDERPGQEQEA